MATAVTATGNNGYFNLSNVSSGTLTGISTGPGINCMTILTVLSYNIGAQVVPNVSSAMGTFQLIKTMNVGTYIQVSFFALPGVPVLSSQSVTIDWGQSMLAVVARFATFQNCYQGIQGIVYLNSVLNSLSASTTTISIPDADNLSFVIGAFFANSSSGNFSSVTGGVSAIGVSNLGVEIIQFGTPTQPQIVHGTNGIAATINGIAVLVLPEYGWVAPAPLPQPIICPYFSGGFARAMVTSLSNLTFLANQSVRIVQDGVLSVDDGQIVSGTGTITLTNPAAVATVGLPYTGTLQWLPLGGDGQTVNQGKERKIFDVILRVWKSLSGYFGENINQTYPISYSESQNYNATDGTLFTGDIQYVPIESQWDDYCQPALIINNPLPFMLLSSIFRSEISEDK